VGTRTRAMSRADHGDGLNALFRGIVNSSADAIAVIDPQMRLVYASPSGWQLLGYEPTELLGKDLLRVVHPDDAKEVLEHLTRTLATLGEAPPKEFRILTRSGQPRHVESSATNRLDDPAVRGVILMIRDVSERAHLTRALRTLGEANQALVRSTDELGLLRQMCETVVDAGGYPLAWVGFAGTTRPGPYDRSPARGRSTTSRTYRSAGPTTNMAAGQQAPASAPGRCR
jgi:PAS domain S-box-containing protein